MSTLTHGKREKSEQISSEYASHKCNQMCISSCSAAGVRNNSIWLTVLPVSLSLSWNSVQHIAASMAATTDTRMMVGRQTSHSGVV